MILTYIIIIFIISLILFFLNSGKLFLREFSKQLFVLPLTVYITFLMPRKETAIRKLLFLMSAIGAIFAIVSIDNASSGLTSDLLKLIPGM